MYDRSRVRAGSAVIYLLHLLCHALLLLWFGAVSQGPFKHWVIYLHIPVRFYYSFVNNQEPR